MKVVLLFPEADTMGTNDTLGALTSNARAMDCSQCYGSKEVAELFNLNG
jgi:hypothetical protein